MGHQRLVAKLMDDGESPHQVALEMLSILPRIKKDPNICKPKIEILARRVVPLDPPVRTIIVGRTGKASLQRIAWTKEEDQVLIQAKLHHHTFRNVMGSLPRRRLCDAYDRWKILKQLPDVIALLSQAGDQTAIAAEQRPPPIKREEMGPIVDATVDEEGRVSVPITAITNGARIMLPPGTKVKKQKMRHVVESDIDDAVCF